MQGTDYCNAWCLLWPCPAFGPGSYIGNKWVIFFLRMDSAPCDGSGGGQWDEWSTGFGPYHLQAFCGPHLKADSQVRKKKKKQHL